MTCYCDNIYFFTFSSLRTITVPKQSVVHVGLLHIYCTVYKCTVYSVQCTVYNVQCTTYSVECTLYIVQCTMCTTHSIQYTVYNVQCTMYNIQ